MVLRHETDRIPKAQLPKLDGIEVLSTASEAAGTNLLTLKLLDSAHKGVFLTLCRDIVELTEKAATEAEAVSLTLSRTWRWHRLLRAGHDDRLSAEEQKGLIGELTVFEKVLLPLMSTADAVAAWRGPLGSSKDFEIGRVCVEAKARKGAAPPFVSISSEDQLDDDGLDGLFLHVTQVDRATEESEGATVTEIARRVTGQIELAAPGAVNDFEAILAAAGLKWEHDYTDFVWLVGESRIYGVSDGFPRLVRSQVASDVSRVKYNVELSGCEEFRLSTGELASALEEAMNGH
jgi:hypothetical protein